MKNRPSRCSQRASSKQLAPRLTTLVILAALCASSCDPATISPGANRPNDNSDLTVTATPDALLRQVGVAIELSASATGGTPPYLFRWDQNAGPADIELPDDTAPSLDLAGFNEPGRYVFRVVVNDQTGATDTDFAVLDFTDSIEATAPTLVLVNEQAPLTVTIDDQLADATFEWSVTRGSASIDNPTTEGATLTATTGETLGVRLTISSAPGDPRASITRDFEVVSIFNLSPDILMETTLGDMTIRLDADAAPGHTANFLAYLDDRFYDGLLFHRASCPANNETGECDPFVIQGGGFERIDGELVTRDVTREPIQSESDNGLTNGEVYSVALALSPGNANSGTTQFFVNLSEDNDFLDAQNFTVFGRVVSGTDVVDAIAAVETVANELLGGEVSLPVEDVTIERVSRVFP